MATRSCSRRGVTLVEAVVVMAILGIFAVAAVPGLSRLRQRSLVGGAARQVAQAIQLARMTAIAQTTPQKLVFEKSGATYTGRYQRFRGPGPGWVADGPAGRIPRLASFSGNAPAITFTHAVEPDGQAVCLPNGALGNTNPNPASIYVSDDSGATRFRVTVNMITGNVKIERVTG